MKQLRPTSYEEKEIYWSESLGVSRTWCWHQLGSGEGPLGSVMARGVVMVRAHVEINGHVLEARERLGGARRWRL